MPRYAHEIKRTSLNLRLDLVAKARAELGTNGTTDTVNRALEEVVRQAAFRRLAEWRIEMTPEEEAELERQGFPELD